MTLSLPEIMSSLHALLLPFIRLSALMLAAPIFGARPVPVRIRVLLALFIALLLYPSIRMNTDFALVSATGLLLVLQQVAVGLGMGLILQFVLASVVMSGHAIATSMGLSFASSVDPQNGVQVTIVGQVYMILATLLFLATNGHLHALELLARSFSAFPLDTFVLNADFFSSIIQFSARMFVTATLLALPVMTGVLLINIGFGVMTRAAPQLNLFSIGFPMAMLGGFCLMLLGLPVLLPLLQDAFDETFVMLEALFNAP